MLTRPRRSIRTLRRVMALLTGATLVQVGPCSEFLGYTLGTTVNSLPSLAYQTALSYSLLPAQLIISSLTGGSSNGGLGGSGSGSGSGGVAGIGGISNPVGTGGLGGLGI